MAGYQAARTEPRSLLNNRFQASSTPARVAILCFKLSHTEYGELRTSVPESPYTVLSLEFRGVCMEAWTYGTFLCILRLQQNGSHAVCGRRLGKDWGVADEGPDFPPLKFTNLETEEGSMLYYALVFLVVAIVAGILGFGGVAFAAAGIAKILFFLFLIAFLISLVTHLGRRGTP